MQNGATISPLVSDARVKKRFAFFLPSHPKPGRKPAPFRPRGEISILSSLFAHFDPGFRSCVELLLVLILLCLSNIINTYLPLSFCFSVTLAVLCLVCALVRDERIG